MTEYDVVVIGGGPAGSMAALTAAQNGLSVLEVERDSAIGAPVRCAEGVDEKGLREFFEPDPAWIGAEITGYALVAPDGSVVNMAMSEYKGYILERVLFDRMVAEKAAAAGALIKTHTEATGMAAPENGRRVVSMRSTERAWDVSARVVIAADGVETRAARWAGLRTAASRHDMESSIQVTCAGIDVDPHTFYLHFTGEFAPGGYAWVFPKKPGTANIGLGISGDHARVESAKKRLARFMARHYPDASVVSWTCGGIACSGGIDRVVADNLMVAGDAAHHANPITGGGIVNALIAGRIAGETAAEAIQAGDLSEKKLSAYAKRIDKRIGAMNRRFNTLKEGIFTISDDSLNALSREMLRLPIEKRTPIRVLSSALMQKPELLLTLAKVVL